MDSIGRGCRWHYPWTLAWYWLSDLVCCERFLLLAIQFCREGVGHYSMSCSQTMQITQYTVQLHCTKSIHLMTEWNTNPEYLSYTTFCMAWNQIPIIIIWTVAAGFTFITDVDTNNKKTPDCNSQKSNNYCLYSWMNILLKMALREKWHNYKLKALYLRNDFHKTIFVYKMNINIIQNLLSIARNSSRVSNNAFVHWCIEGLISIHSTFSQVFCEFLTLCMKTCWHGVDCWAMVPKNRQDSKSVITSQ